MFICVGVRLLFDLETLDIENKKIRRMLCVCLVMGENSGIGYVGQLVVQRVTIWQIQILI